MVRAKSTFASEPRPPSGSRPWTWLALVALAYVTLPNARAAAYEDEGSVGLSLGYGLVAIEAADLPDHGGLLTLSAALGIDDVFTARAHVGYAWHPGHAADLHVAVAGLEAIYLLDVVELVPFFGLGVGALMTAYDGGFGADASIYGVLGLDYLWSREVIVGIDLRPHVLPLSLASVAAIDPVYITASVRMSWVFET